jgi:hypothetical protein
MTENRTVLLMSEGVSHGEYKELKSYFSKTQNWNFIVLNNETIYRLYNSLPNDYIESKHLNENFCHLKSKKELYDGEFDFIFDNEFLNFQFEAISHELNFGKKIEKSFSFLLDFLRPDLIIFGHEAFTVERLLVRSAKKRKIITIGLLHSGLGFKYGYRGIVGEVDYVLVWNSIDKEFISEFDIPEDNIFNIGSIRFNKKYKRYQINLKNKFELNSNNKSNKILILTASINSGLSAPIASPTLHIKLIRELLLFIEQRQDLIFIFKPHPSYDHYELYRQLRKFNLSNLIFDENLTLDEAIKNSSLCLMINYFTTAAIEVMFENIPVVFLNNAVYPMKYWVTNDTYNNILQISNINELEFVIEKLNYDNKFRKNLLKNNSYLLKNILNNDSKSSISIFSLFISNNILPHLKDKIKDDEFSLVYSPSCFFIYGISKKITIIRIFKFKLFRINNNIKNYKYSDLLNKYVLGSNSNETKESFFSFFYLFILCIINLDLLFKENVFKKKYVLTFIFRQITRNIHNNI